MEGILHAYIKKPALNLFEYTPRHPTTSSTLPTTPPNILLFIGGLYDNFSSPPYLIDLAQLFPRHNDQQWALKHVQLSSATLRCVCNLLPQYPKMSIAHICYPWPGLCLYSKSTIECLKILGLGFAFVAGES